MVRAWLLLLSLLLASPAAVAAPCHEQPSVAAAGQHHRHQPAAPVPIAAAHDCIGCIPLGNWLGPRLAAPALIAGAAPVAAPSRLPRAAATRPIPPPPRRG